eukprot:scaffold78506_cov39-Prasinocladus_malaysianus.AAC.1
MHLNVQTPVGPLQEHGVPGCMGYGPIAPWERVGYWPPKPPMGKHRYIFLLYEQGEADVVVPSTDRKQWDVQEFLTANPELKPAAINFFYST